MSRVKIDMPDEFRFSTNIPVRISDINYGGHAGNDSILSFIHESRVRFFSNLGFGELDMFGVGLIMSDVVIEFKSEIFYGDQLTIHIACREITKVSFNLYYKLEKTSVDGVTLVALAKTGMLAFDYSKKKVTSIPEEAVEKLSDN